MSYKFHDPYASFEDVWVNTDGDNIYRWFKLLFPKLVEFNKYWLPYGKDRILLRQTNMCDLIFTYKNEIEWDLTTVDNYLSQIFV